MEKEQFETPKITESQLEEIAEKKFNGDYDRAYAFLKVSPEDIILDKSVPDSEPSDSTVASTGPEIISTSSNLGKNKNLLKAISWYSHANKLDGLLYGHESGHPNIKEKYSGEQLDDFADRSRRLKKMGRQAVLGSLGSDVLSGLGYPSKVETEEDEQLVADKFYDEITGPKNEKKAR